MRPARLLREERLQEGLHRPFGRHRLGRGGLPGRRRAGTPKYPGFAPALAVLFRPFGRRCQELAENLGIEYNVIPITEIYTSVVNTLKPVIGGREFDATEENIQTRIRTVLLMAVQNKADYILLNSSNKSENALGLCTLYGDTAGAFSPTGDLYKSEMYDLARYINRTQGDPIPGNILDKEPSSELHPGQKDSDILPPYEVVDAILYRMIEEGQHREEIVNAGFDSGSWRRSTP